MIQDLLTKMNTIQPNIPHWIQSTPQHTQNGIKYLEQLSKVLGEKKICISHV